MKPESISRLKDIQLSECEISNSCLYFQGCLYVSDNELRLLVLGLAHDLSKAEHSGKNHLYNLVSCHYWWPNLHKATAIYATGCHSCRRVINSRFKYQGTLKPLPVSLQRWRNITVNFVDLCQGHHIIVQRYDTIVWHYSTTLWYNTIV